MKTMAAWLNLSKTNTEFDRIAAVAVLDSLIAKYIYIPIGWFYMVYSICLRCPDDNGRFDQELFNEVFDTLEQVALCDPHFLVRMVLF